MIFAIKDHVTLIQQRKKTETRRPTGRYRVGYSYAIQPCRTCKGISDGRIVILKKWVEPRGLVISPRSAEDEGGYTPLAYEALYETMYPSWRHRVAYRFLYVRTP